MNVRRNVPLAAYTTLGLGGPAGAFVEARSTQHLIEAVTAADDAHTPLLLLGGGSNLVVADEGFDGTVVRVATRGRQLVEAGDTARVLLCAGEPWDGFVAWAVANELAGVECLSGIPGCVGATPIQNVGAYGQEVSEVITAVRVWDRRDRAQRTLLPGECAFGYRDSVFKREARGRYAVLSVAFALRRGGAPSVRYGELQKALGDGDRSLARVRETVLSLRRAKGMVWDADDPEGRTAGSFFTNPVVTEAEAEAVLARAAGVLRQGESMPRWPTDDGRVKLAAGWLIERAGVTKGWTIDGAGVSHRHALALVNRGGTTRALLAMAARVQDRVREVFGVGLEIEPERVG
ncbi:MAG: UDP-N-acetylmuramate dehydrogenase [Deltaproteobacteria bacterium]|nr:UDP-N-acetylmuramate dehydrogenase [Myxococcales bacterium]MDP3217038.1 UDP-N-acetylmuramate dehydrogenase [Deltaproteobacteria bacterium]